MSCSKCLEKINALGIPSLCEKCEAYANQDYVGRRDDVLYGGLLEDLAYLFDDLKFPTSSEEAYLLKFEKILEAAKLKSGQRRVLRLYFLEGLKPRQIAEKLGIPVRSVWNLYEKAIQKMQKSRRIALLVKGKDLKVPSKLAKSNKSTNTSFENRHGPIKCYVPDPDGSLKIDRIIDVDKVPPRVSEQSVTKQPNTKSVKKFYPWVYACPRCGDRVFHSYDSHSYCADCGWTEDLYED